MTRTGVLLFVAAGAACNRSGFEVYNHEPAGDGDFVPPGDDALFSGDSDGGVPLEAATGLAWSEDSPHGDLSVTANWTRSPSPTLVNQLIRFYDDPSCSSPMTGFVDLGSNTVESYAHTVVDGSTTHFQVTSVGSGGTQSASTCSGAMLVDLSPPQITNLTINDDDPETPTNFIRVSMAGNDFIPITEFCLKYEDTAKPTASAPCWVAVDSAAVGLTPSPDINITDFNFMLDFAPKRYNLFVWMKDALDHISDLTASGSGTLSVDTDWIDYYPGEPPIITDILAVNSDAPADVPTQADLTMSAGADVFIKWAASDDDPLPAAPISLFFSTDDQTWTEIAADLDNDANGTCLVDNLTTSADDNDTGCYRWVGGAPVDTFFRIRVAAKDIYDATTFATSAPVNLPNLRFIAGNTEPGLGAHATSSVFFPRTCLNERPLRAVVVLDNGITFVNDNRGLLKIDPVSMLQTLYLRDEDAVVGDGVPVEDATALSIGHIALDYDNGLIIYDDDRIRRIDLETDIITDFIGGGSNTADIINDPLDIQLQSIGSCPAGDTVFTPLPNGDFLFLSEPNSWNPKAIRHFHADTGQITTLSMQGPGYFGNATQEISVCMQNAVGVTFNSGTSAIEKILLAVRKAETGFPSCQGNPWGVGGHGLANIDPVTGDSTSPHSPDPTVGDSTEMSLVTSRSGDLYAYAPADSSVHRYDPSTNTWTHVLGTGASGICPDETDALSCNVLIRSLFVNARGRLFFIDNDMIRTLDDNNRVRTLMGQPRSWGDGENPLSARIGAVETIKLTDNGDLIFLDYIGASLRRVEVDGSGSMGKIAGNGDDAAWDTAQPAIDQPIKIWLSGGYAKTFGLDPTNNVVYFPRVVEEYHRLDLNDATPKWQPLVYGTTYDWFDPAADGRPGDQVDFQSTYSNTLGFDGSQLLLCKSDYQGGEFRPMLKLYATADGTQAHLIGLDDATLGFPTDGVVNASSHGDAVDIQAQWYANQWLVVGNEDRRSLRNLDSSNIGTFVQTNNQIRSFHYVSADDLLYYADANGNFYRIQPPNVGESPVDLGISTLRVGAGSILLHDSGSERELIFPYIQNGLYGIVAYRLP